ncbi:MAG: hypothetical protein ACRDL8_00335 [Solirubrobacteraceae bacterium]
MSLRELSRRSDLSAAAQIPSVSVRVALAVAAALLSAVVYGSSGWLAVGIIFGLLAARAPEYLLAWPLIVFLGIGELGRQAALSWQILVLLAGVHLIHVLAMLTLGLPWRSSVQRSVLTRALRRFIAIQIPVQLLGVAALALLAPNAHGQRPLTVTEFTIIGAAALAGLALLLRPSASAASRS